MREHTSNKQSNVAAQNAEPPLWRGVRVCHNTHDVVDVHGMNVHRQVEELVALVCGRLSGNPRLGKTLQVCTRNIGTVMRPHATMEFRPTHKTKHPVLAICPTPQDGSIAMTCPARYGLLCTVFEWYRVAVDNEWSLGPYDMRRWDFLGSVSPVPYVHERDSNLSQYMVCARTGFRRWTVSAMLDALQHRYVVNDHVLQNLRKVASQ